MQTICVLDRDWRLGQRRMGAGSKRLLRAALTGMACMLAASAAHGQGDTESGSSNRSQSPALPESSWWPEWRRDGHRSGHTDLTGDIVQPAELWRYFLGVPFTDTVDDQTQTPPSDALDLDGRGGAYRMSVAGSSVSVADAASGIAVWQYELKARSEGYHVPLIADFDPARVGLEAVIWPIEGNYSGDFQDQAYCFGFAQGAANGTLLWTLTPPTGEIHMPTFLAADVRETGGDDLIALSWTGVKTFNGVTGRLDHQVQWNAIRHYGHAAWARHGPDRRQRLVNIADYVPHVHVAEFGGPGRGDRLVWERHYYVENTPRDAMLRTRPNSVSDLDGDGAPEVTLNLFSEQRDLKWRLLILDIESGKKLVEAVDQFVWGIEDLDGDGQPELLCCGTSRINPRDLGELAIYRYFHGDLQKLWAIDGARYLTTNVHQLPPGVVTGAVDGRTTVLCADVDGDGAREFLIEADSDGDRRPDRFEAFALDRAGAVTLKWRYQADAGTTVNARRYGAVDDSGRPLLQFCDPASGEMLAVDRDGRQASRGPSVASTYATVPVAGDIDGDGRCEIALVNSRREVELLTAPRQGAAAGPALRWKRRGHGMILYQGYTLPDMMVAFADVDGDGQAETLFCGETQDGGATLVAARPDGDILWEHAFDGVGTDGIFSGVSRWFTGHFLGHKGNDVGVVYHRIGGGSNELAMLDGRTGQSVWGPVSQPALPAGGGPASVGNRPLQAVHDFNGDGKDDIAYHDVYFNVVLSGATGETLAGKGVVDIFGTTLNYAYLMLADVDRRGDVEMVLHGPLMHTMAQTTDMKKLWFRDFDNRANHFPPALTVLDETAVLGMPGEDGVFRCIRAVDGRTLWEEPIGHPGATSVGAADIDGDGVVDFFYLDKSGELVAVRGKSDGEETHLMWTLAVGPGQHPIFADVDGDGKGEFLLVTQDGWLRCVGSATEIAR